MNPDEDITAIGSSGASSVEINTNAKGETAYKVKVYVGETLEQVSDAAVTAVTIMSRLKSGMVAPR